jgi:hypothetical protein
VLAGNLIGHWLADDLNARLEDGAAISRWVDSTAAIPAVAQGEPQLVKDRWLGHSVVRFDPTDGADQLRVAADVSPMSGAEDFTIAVVFGTQTAGQGGESQWWDNTGIVDADNRLDTGDWGLALNSQGQVAAGLGRSARTVYSSETGLNDGQFHVVTYTRRGPTLNIYVDEGSSERMRNGDTFPRDVSDMTFGSLQTDSNYFTGDIAEIRFGHDVWIPADQFELLHRRHCRNPLLRR